MSRHLRGFVWALVLVQLCSGLACAGMRGWGRKSQPEPEVVCVLPPDASIEDIVGHVNQQVAQLDGWTADKIKIDARMGPYHMPLEANLHVQKPQNLRLLVTSLAGQELELGSNDEHFWYWSRQDNPKLLMYCAHSEMDVAQQRLEIPFEPDWLLEVLSIRPIDAERVTLQKAPNSRAYSLVTHSRAPSGHPIKRITVVDACTGHVIEHSIYDGFGQVVAQAYLRDHHIDPQSGVAIPRRIKLSSPPAQVTMDLKIRGIHCNPTHTPDRIFELPENGKLQLVNLADDHRQTR